MRNEENEKMCPRCGHREMTAEMFCPQCHRQMIEVTEQNSRFNPLYEERSNKWQQQQV